MPTGRKSRGSWFNFLNKILVENQCHLDASSFQPSVCLALRLLWASFSLSKTRAVQEERTQGKCQAQGAAMAKQLSGQVYPEIPITRSALAPLPSWLAFPKPLPWHFAIQSGPFTHLSSTAMGKSQILFACSPCSSLSWGMLSCFFLYSICPDLTYLFRLISSEMHFMVASHMHSARARECNKHYHSPMSLCATVLGTLSALLMHLIILQDG
jgi:hypothetical protein